MTDNITDDSNLFLSPSNSSAANDQHDIDHPNHSSLGDMVWPHLYRVSSFASMISTLCIVMETYLDRKHGTDTPFTRILFFFASALFISATANIFGVWTADDDRCTEVATFTVFGSGSALLWDMVLSIAYLGVVRYGWRDARVKRLEAVAHFIIWPLIASLVVFTAVMNLFNFDGHVCTAFDNGDRTRVNPIAAKVVIMLSVILLLSSLLTSAVCMVLIYMHARVLEARNRRYHFNATSVSATSVSSSTRSLASFNRSFNRILPRFLQRGDAPPHNARPSYSNKLAWNGILYSGNVLLAKLPFVILTRFIHPPDSLVVIAIHFRLQYGLFYLFIFFRQRKSPRTWLGRFLRRIVCCWEGSAPSSSGTAQRARENPKPIADHKTTGLPIGALESQHSMDLKGVFGTEDDDVAAEDVSADNSEGED